MAELNVHAAVGLLRHLFGGVALVVGDYAAAQICVEAVAQNAGRVTVDNLARIVRRLQLSYDVPVGADDAWEVHKFAQSKHFVAAYVGLNVLAGEYCAAVLERRCGHARGELDIHVEGYGLRSLIDVLHPRHSADIGYLVRIGDYSRCAAGDDERGELFGREHRTFDVHVTVDIAGQDVQALYVILLCALVVADADYAVGGYCDVALLDLAREGVYEGCVL